MATKIVTKNSSTASAVPTASDLVQGELAVNVADKRLFTEDNGGAIVELGTNPSTIDINAGTIDGTAIGASSASTGAFTTLTATGAFTSLGIDDNATSTAITIDSSENVGIGTASPNTVTNYTGLTLNNATYGGFIDIENNGTHTFRVLSNTTASYIGTIESDPLVFNTNDTERMRIDSSGQVRLGNSTPVWDTTFSSLVTKGGFLGSQSASYLYSGQNGYYNGGWKYSSTAPATLTEQAAGAHIFYNAASGSAGATISWAERMRIDSSGNLGIGTSTANGKMAVIKDGSSGANNNTTDSAIVVSSSAGAAANMPLALRYTGIGLTGIGGQNYASQIVSSSVSANALEIFTTGASSLVLGTAATERLRIDSSGNLLVGTASVISSGQQCIEFDGYAKNGLILKTTNTAMGSAYLGFVNSSGAVIGSINQLSTSTVAYNTSSDQRLKENIADADDAGSKIDSIQVRQYDWKVDGSHQDYGMIAQELQAVAPEAVSGDADSEDMMGVDYSKLVPMLVKEIQSLRNRVAQLEE
jgi:hypothetical protein